METTYKQIDRFIYDPNSKPLRKGEFGNVFRGIDLQNNDNPVAIKVISAKTLEQNKDFAMLFQREISILKQVKCDYILKPINVLQTPSRNVYIITNLYNGGSLSEILSTRKTLPEYEALRILRQCAEAFVSLENLNLENEQKQKVVVMHHAQNIKPENILFHEGDVRIADMSPQILGNKSNSYKCDVWSMGMVIFECLFGRIPWELSSMYGLLKNIANKHPKYFDFGTMISKDTQDLLIQMLEMEEKRRIDWYGILAHGAIVKNKADEERKFEIETSRTAGENQQKLIGLKGTELTQSTLVQEVRLKNQLYPVFERKRGEAQKIVAVGIRHESQQMSEEVKGGNQITQNIQKQEEITPKTRLYPTFEPLTRVITDEIRAESEKLLSKQDAQESNTNPQVRTKTPFKVQYHNF